MIYQFYFWGYTYSKELKVGSQRDICTSMFIAVLLRITKMWKQPRCPSMDEWISIMWSIHTMEYYSALKRKEILTHAMTWMKLEDIILSEISHTQKDEYCMIHLYEVLRISQKS